MLEDGRVSTDELHSLPEGWESRAVMACILPKGVENKGSIQQRKYQSSGRFPVVDQGTALVAGYTDEETVVYQQDLPLILFGDHTRVFKFLDFPFATGADGTKLLKPNRQFVDAKFLYYALLKLEIPSRGYNRHFKYLKEGKILCPSDKGEQRAIAAVLGKIQAAIEVQQRIVATLKELKAATMAKFFREGTRGERLKQTEIGEMPESWEVVEIGSRCEKISKGSSPRWQGFEYVDDGVLFIRSQNVGSGRMDFSDRAYLPRSFNEKERRSILQAGDILVNLVGASIGRVALGTHEIEGANCNQAVCFVRMKCDRMIKEFVVFFLLSPAGQRQMFFQKKEIARANLSLMDVRSFKVPMPRPDEVAEIVRFFACIEHEVSICERKKSALSDLFRSTLHLLMTGQIRVNGLNLEDVSQ